MNQTNCSTSPTDLLNPVLLFRGSAKSTSQRLRVRAVANLAGYYIIIADYEARTVIHRDIGELPKGFTFNQATAELYSLCQAARWIAANMPGVVIAMVNTSQPSPRRLARKAAA